MRDIFHEYELNRQLLVLAHCTALMLATKTIEEEKLAVGNEYFLSTEPYFGNAQMLKPALMRTDKDQIATERK